jgi:hypothetical protein
MESVRLDYGALEETLNELLTVGASLLLDDSLDKHDLRNASNCNRMSETLSNALRLDILPAYNLYGGEHAEDSYTGNTSDHVAKLYVRCAQVYQIVTRSINPIFVFGSGDGGVLEKTIDELNIGGFPQDMNLIAVRTGDPCEYRAADPIELRGLSLLRDLPDATGMFGGPDYIRTMLLDTYDPVREAFTDMTPRSAERHRTFREMLAVIPIENSGKRTSVAARSDAGSKTLWRYKKHVDRLRKKMAVHQEELMSALSAVFSTIRISEDGRETITIDGMLGGDIRNMGLDQWLENAGRTLDSKIVPRVKKTIKALRKTCDKEMKALVKMHQATVAELEIRRLEGQIQTLEKLGGRQDPPPPSFFLGV